MRGFNGPVLVGTLLPTAREVRGGVSARAQALNETVRKKMRRIYEMRKRVRGRNPPAPPCPVHLPWWLAGEIPAGPRIPWLPSPHAAWGEGGCEAALVRT